MTPTKYLESYPGQKIVMVHREDLEEWAKRLEAVDGMLKRIEWIGSYDYNIFCPSCKKRRMEGHTPDCEVAAILHPAKG